jgi:glycosyltransferase involved in cell wall biosynthesis
VRLLGNGIDLRRFSPDRFSPAHRQAIRARLGFSDDTVVVGTVGRLVEEKGYPELFAAMSALDPRFRLLVVGPEDPEKADAVPAESVEAARRDGAVVLGHRTDVDELYGAMDVFVLASHREGFPRAAMEAAAMGLPIVATDIRGCRQVVDDGVNGVLVRPRDSRALASAIDRLGDSELRSKLGAAGIAIAKDRFDERRCVDIVLRTYSDVAQRKGIESGA